MNDTNDTKRINVQLPAELHKELKVFAASQKQTLEVVVTNAIKDTIKEQSK